MIERDDHIPPLEELCAELARARALCERTLAADADGGPGATSGRGARAPRAGDGLDLRRSRRRRLAGGTP